jgi:sensor histidine kinase YesM
MTVVQYIHFAAELWGALFSLLAAVSVFITRYFDKKGGVKLCRLMLCAALLMISDALAWLFRGNPDPACFYVVRAANFCAFLFGFLMIPLSAEFISHTISKRSGIYGLYWTNIEWVVFTVAAVCLTINLFFPFMYDFDERNTYFRLFFGWLPGVFTIFGLIVSVGVVVKYIKYLNTFEKFSLLSYLSLPIICTVLQIIFYGISFVYLAVVVSSFIMFMSYEYNYMHYNIEREKHIADERIRLINHQIRPHFIFNTLSVIRFLCQKDPDEAARTINEFSGYLRGSVDFLNETDCIPFEKEIELVKHYVYIEQKRFGKSVSVEYDITDSGFMIPPFSVQTSVENAIKHGLLENGVPDGKVTIKSYIQNNDHVIEITDNGTGFDTEALTDEDSHKHVGIKSAIDRIRLMCKGEMQIQSESGRGTKVIITIPVKRGQKNEYTDR